MTTRELLIAIIENAEMTSDHKAKAQEMLAQLDRERKPTKAQLEKQANNALLKERILEILNGITAPMLTTMIAETLSTDDAPITFSKVSPLCRQLRDEGLLIEVEVKVKGKGTQKGYYLPC